MKKVTLFARACLSLLLLAVAIGCTTSPERSPANKEPNETAIHRMGLRGDIIR